MKVVQDRSPTRHLQLAQGLGQRGWALCEDFLHPTVVRALAAECRQRWRAGAFRPARIGTGKTLQLRPDIRGDHILWLDEAQLTAAERHYLDELERLRLAINRTLFLGLFSLEAHLTVYPKGAFYRRHRDQFHDNRQRIVTGVLYLNEQWRASDGGQLRLYPTERETGAAVEIWPRAGTLVIFLSAMPHEVLPTRRERMSITGWFKRRS